MILLTITRRLLIGPLSPVVAPAASPDAPVTLPADLSPDRQRRPSIR
uniref:Uncharacterized protein n=1 Tax=Verrucosispora sp. MS100047 TaxID=1410949 RepID=A0A097CRX5_9ACTN|nr:hypothetical protein VASRM7_189 [Verrucosispora sp. MS100047]